MLFVKAKGILSSTNGMNIYRGCTHGCIYCDSRSKCYQMHHAFEDIEVKQNAPELLEKALKSKRKKCMIGMGSMCDPYMPLEEELNLTRHCLQIIDKYGFGATLITKSSRVLRDLDLFESIHHQSKCVIQMTLTTYDEGLCQLIEPNVSSTKERIETLKILKAHGIPTIVWLSPILPYLNDTKENLQYILDACIEAEVKGIICFGFGLTLRDGNREYYYQALDKHFPGLKEKYIHRYGKAYQITSPHHNELMRYFVETCKKHNIMYTPQQCFDYLKEFPMDYEQLSLF